MDGSNHGSSVWRRASRAAHDGGAAMEIASVAGIALTAAVVAGVVSARWPKDWRRRLVADAIACAVVGALLTTLFRG
jgi:hypothetical protein